MVTRLLGLFPGFGGTENSRDFESASRNSAVEERFFPESDRVTE